MGQEWNPMVITPEKQQKTPQKAKTIYDWKYQNFCDDFKGHFVCVWKQLMAPSDRRAAKIIDGPNANSLFLDFSDIEWSLLVYSDFQIKKVYLDFHIYC